MCPAGYVVTGGGGVTLTSGVRLRIIGSMPSAVNGILNNWQVEWENASAVGSFAQAYAVCVPAQ
jgi:hypothetical protein